jgi:muramoyltetrapeptide carboxypeptidase
MAVDKPPALTRGGTIGIVAPSGTTDKDALDQGIKALRKDGFAVELGQNIYARKGYLAGNEQARVADLVDFFCRADIEAIFCARGGFGSIQLLPALMNGKGIRPKIFVGYSDVTVLLNWFLQHHGMVTFHAPMVAMDIARGLSDRARKHFWGTLTGETRTWTVGLGEVIRPGAAEAEMMGGCLSLLVTTLGTPYEIDTRGKLLFIEDVDESPYRIERMLTHLKMAGRLDGIAGVVFGDFTRCESEGPRGVREIIAELFHDAPYPVVTGLTAGHGIENLTLPFGVKMALDAGAATLSLAESPVA